MAEQWRGENAVVRARLTVVEKVVDARLYPHAGFACVGAAASPFPAPDARMVIFQEPPHFSERSEVLDLLRRELRDFDARTLRELPVRIEDRQLARDLRHLGDRHAVHEEFEIVHPDGPLAVKQRAEEYVAGERMERQLDPVLRPIGGAGDRTVLHVVEGDAAKCVQIQRLSGRITKTQCSGRGLAGRAAELNLPGFSVRQF